MAKKNEFSGEWGSILGDTAEGVSQGLEGRAHYKQAKREDLEARRRMFSNLLNSAFKRNRGLLKKGQEYGDEMNDYKSQALQNVARGFVESLQGSIPRG